MNSSVRGPTPAGRLALSTPVLIATIITVCTGFSSQMVMPLWVGAVMDDYHLAADVVGRIASIEFFTVAVVSLIVATQVHQLNVRLLSLLGLVCLLVGNGGAITVHDIELLTALRALAGIGKGLMVAGIFSLVARTEHPTRSFAILNASYAAFSAGFYLIIPVFIQENGAAGAFMSMFGITVIGCLTLYWVPSGLTTTASTMESTTDKGGISLEGILVLLALVMLWTGNSAIWTFVERIGARTGLDVTKIGAVLSFAALLTVLGPSLAHVLHTRFGFRRPIIVALTLNIGVAAVVCNIVDQAIFVGFAPFLNVLALFIVPYLMGLMSFADPKGRLAAAAAAAMTAGGSLGSYVGGVTLTRAGYSTLSLVAIGFFLLVMVLVHFAVRQIPVTRLEQQTSV